MFEWLNKIFDWLFQFVPQFVIVSPHEQAVRVNAFPWVKEWVAVCKPGWHCYWPLFQSFEKLIVKPKIIVLELSCEGTDGSVVESLWAVQYWIQNIQKAIFEAEDYEELLVSHAAKVVGEYVKHHSEPCPLDTITKEIRSSVSGIGLYIQQVFPVQYVKARAYKIFFENLAERVGRIVG